MKKLSKTLLGKTIATLPLGRNQIQFTDATIQSGIAYQGQSWGSYWGDFNGDGWTDLWVANHVANAAPNLWLNQRNGTFVDGTSALRGIEGDFHGAAWADFDNDGDQDLFHLTGGPTTNPFYFSKRLYVTENGELIDRANQLGVNIFGLRGRTPLWLDYNNDGLLDLVMTAAERPSNPPTIFRQTRSGFVNARTETNFDIDRSLFALWSDLSGDRIPELIVWESGRDKTIYDTRQMPFRDITNTLKLPVGKGFVEDVTIGDFNGDLRPDMLIASRGFVSDLFQVNTTRVESLLTNVSQLKGISFQTTGNLSLNIPLSATKLTLTDFYIGGTGVHPNETTFTLSPGNPKVRGILPFTPGTSKGLFIGYDPDQHLWKIFGSNPIDSAQIFIDIQSTTAIQNIKSIGFNPAQNAVPDQLLINTPSGFVDRSQQAGITVPTASKSVVSGDFDNDMDEDLYILTSSSAGNTPNLLYENQGDGTFTPILNAGGAGGTRFGLGDSVTVADYDRDGFLDLFITNGDYTSAGDTLFFDEGIYQLFHNQGNGNHWLEIDLVGRLSNRDGIGAQLLATAGGITQLRQQSSGTHNRAQDDKRIHFGLGLNSTVDKLEVLWPSQTRQVLTGIRADQVFRLVEGQGDRGNDQLFGTDSADRLLGLAGNDVLVGRGGADILTGGKGRDTLTGSDGSDGYGFDSPLEGGDRIMDFNPQLDVIRVNAQGFGGGLALGELSPTQFVLGSVATDRSDRFLFQVSTGNLFFDRDGIGSQSSILLATLSSQPGFDSSNIQIF
jgi:hypothetical protein